MNWMVLPALALAFALFAAGTWLWRHARTPVNKTLAMLVALVVSVPGILFATYYLHLFDNAAWFYQLRSLPFLELTAGGAGLLAGVMAAIVHNSVRVARPLLLGVLALGVAVPHVKPVISPLPANSFEDRWREDVCLQSTASSCGPASAATLLRTDGIHMSEAEIARRCFTYSGGTENWYLARLFRHHGYKVRFITNCKPEDQIPVPSIAGVSFGGKGHFIPIIAETATTYVTGDPLAGKQEWSKDVVRQHFHFTGFFMVIQKKAHLER